MALFNSAEITAMRAGQKNQDGGNAQAVRLQLQQARLDIGALSRELADAKNTIASQKEYIQIIKKGSANENQLQALRSQLEHANKDRCNLRSELRDAKETIAAFKEQRESKKFK